MSGVNGKWYVVNRESFIIGDWRAFVSGTPPARLYGSSGQEIW